MASDSSIDIKPIILINPRERPEEALYKELSTTLKSYPRIKSEPEDFDTPSAIDSSEDSKPQVKVKVPEPHCLSMVVPKREAGPDRFPCFMCSAHFSSKSALDAHLLIHPEESPYSCDQCGEGFTQESEMQMHRRNHDRYKPVVMPMRFQTPSNVSPKRWYACRICSIGFASEKTLMRHSLRHVEKSHLCNVCNKSFSTNDALQSHQKKHEQMAQCPICDKTILRRYYTHHINEHNLTCDVCDKGFATKTTLKRHMRTCNADDSE